MPSTDQQQYDLVIVAQHVIPFDPAATETLQSEAQAIAVSDGSIVRLGTAAEAENWQTDQLIQTTGTVTPGLIDAHSHAITAIRNTSGADLTQVSTVTELEHTLTAYGEEHLDEPWLYGWGLDPSAMSGQPLDKTLLDRISPDRPCFIRLFDGHGALASSLALAAANVTGPLQLAAGSEVVCDADGVPTGLLQEFEAMTLIESFRPGMTTQEYAAAVIASLNDMAQSGLTFLNLLDDWGKPEDILTEATQQTQLPVTIQISPLCVAGTGEEDWQRIAERQGRSGDRWQVCGVKFFLDGTIDNGTAWLNPADTNGESTSSTWTDPDAYRSAVHFFAERGIYTATHAIGDAAVEWAIAAIADSPKVAGVNHRIEHIETIRPEHLPMLTRSGAVASMQPTHSTHFLRADGTDNWTTRLGCERALVEGFRYREILEAGVPLSISSDWPVAPYDPRETIASAVGRTNPKATVQEPVLPDQKLTVEQAFHAHTAGAAHAVNQEDALGSITPGKRATFTVFSQHPFQVATSALADLPVLMTVVDGVPAYRA